jgi:hypothetical protein
MPLQIRRGTAAERSSLTTSLVVGELLYVTDQGKLYIGDGTTLTDPTDILGNSGQGGKGLIVTGFTTEDAIDAVGAALAAGSHSNGISFTYGSTQDTANRIDAAVDLSNYVGNVGITGILDITGELRADSLKASIFSEDSSLLVDAIDGKFFGDLEGSVTGPVVGDLTGSVFSDGSTVLVDGVEGLIVGSVKTNGFVEVDSNSPGTVTLSVNSGNDVALFPSVLGFRRSRTTIENPTAVVANDVLMNQIAYGYDGSNFSASAAIQSIVDGAIATGNVPGKLAFATVNNSGLLETHVTIDRTGKLSSIGGGVEIFNYGDTSAGSTTLASRRSRGTVAAPTVPAVNDQLLNFIGTTWDGTNYLTSTVIGSLVDGAISTGIAPGRIFFATADTSGNLTTRVSIDNTGKLFAAFGLQADTQQTAGAPIISTQAHSAATSSALVLRRSRGNLVSPAAVQNGDILHAINFAGYEGSSYNNSVTIRAIVNGAIGTNIVPGEFQVRIRNSAGVIDNRLTVSSDLATFSVPVRTPSIEISENNINGLNSNEDITVNPSGTGTVDFVIPEQGTVGSAGAAAALPATPSTYFKIKVNGVDYVVPAYAVS